MPGMASVTSTRRRGRLAAVVLAAALMMAGCADTQDPGLVDTPGDDPGTTSNTLGQCPAGGPDSTTPSAGCIDDDGQVVRP